jgi:hypothetical protein
LFPSLVSPQSTIGIGLGRATWHMWPPFAVFYRPYLLSWALLIDDFSRTL